MSGLHKTKSHWLLSVLTCAFVCLTICLCSFSCCAETENAAADEMKVLQISACSEHLTLLLSDGTVKCYGTLPPEASETVGQWTGIRQISEGGEYLLGLTESGKVLTVPIAEEHSVWVTELPAQAESLSGIDQISAGYGFLLALDHEGVVHCLASQKMEAVLAADGISEVREVHAAGQSVILLMRDGTLRVLGDSEMEENAKLLTNVDSVVSAPLENGLIVRFADGQTTAIGRIFFRSGTEEPLSEILSFSSNPLRQNLWVRRDGTVGTDNRMVMDKVITWEHVIDVQCGTRFFAALREDGTIYTCGDDERLTAQMNGQYEPREPGNVTAVSAGYSHTLLLKKDGTVQAFGKRNFNACDVEEWQDVTAIAAGAHHSVGLKADGTVLTAGKSYALFAADEWRNIVAIGAGLGYTVGLDQDGRFHVAGTLGDLSAEAAEKVLNFYAEKTPVRGIGTGCTSSHLTMLCGDVGTLIHVGNAYQDMNTEKINAWNGLSQLAAGDGHTLGVKKDGTVAADGYNRYGQCDTDDLQDIIQAACGMFHSAFLTKDGRVICRGSNERGACNTQGWQNVTAVSAGGNHTVALTADGLVLAAGDNGDGQCDIPVQYQAPQDDTYFTPSWYLYQDALMYGQRNQETWFPNGFIVYESPVSSTYGVNRAGITNYFNWNGLCVSLPRDGGGKADSIHILQCENGRILMSWRFFEDGTIRGADEVNRIYEIGADSEEILPEHLKSFTEGKYRAEIQENQEGNLHYGTYRVLNTETQAEIFRMEVSENGSVQYSWNGQYISYDAPKNVYSHRTESQ